MRMSGLNIVLLALYTVLHSPDCILANSITGQKNDDSYSIVKGDSLFIGNEQVEYSFVLNTSNLILTGIKDKVQGNSISFGSSHKLFSIGNETNQLLDVEISTREISYRSDIPPFLQTELIFKYNSVWIKQVLSINGNIKAIDIESFIMKKTNELDFTPNETHLCHLVSLDPHTHFSAIEFYDQTDIFNTLVFKKELSGFRHPSNLVGNILLIDGKIHKHSFWILKKAPCSGVQLHYPGYDFEVSQNYLTISGAGIVPEDLLMNEWIPYYGFAIGSPSNSYSGMIKNLRLYQKNIHKTDPKVLEMVMMNTWGDRNRDASINETFVLKEIANAAKLGITHFQIDDGWQQGRSMNSAEANGQLWESWTYADWTPDSTKFPEGFANISAFAKEKNVQLGLWFNPSRINDYESWQTDASILIRLYKHFGIRFFKIDGIEIPTKKAELNLRKFYSMIQDSTQNAIIFNIDATAGNRGGYFYLNDYGNIFLENRYTDWANYYPYQTLRNLWMLSEFVAPERLQIEFLNKWRNQEKYLSNDPLAPKNVPFDYQFAITMMAQPLAWFEATGLPPEAFELADVVQKYVSIQADLHQGIILPIGKKPDGRSWTGFQSIRENGGYFLVFRELNNNINQSIRAFDLENKKIQLDCIAGHGKNFTYTTDQSCTINFSLSHPHTYSLYKYKVIDD